MKKVYYRSMEFVVYEGVYEPAEDTFLLADNLTVRNGERVLELGTGCGILSILAAKMGGRVVATDINPRAIECAMENCRIHQVEIDFRLGNLFEPVKDEKFDLILFNPPYLPTEPSEEENQATVAWSGGVSGRKVLDPFLIELPRHLLPAGRAMFVQSSLSDPARSIWLIEGAGLKWRILVRRRFFFEELLLFEVRTL